VCNAEGVGLVQAQQRERQQRAAVDLKHHIDEAQAGLADKAEVHQTRAKQQADMHAREFNALLETGQNPYAVSRTTSLSHIFLDIGLTFLQSVAMSHQTGAMLGACHLAACSQPAYKTFCILTCIRTSASALHRHASLRIHQSGDTCTSSQHLGS